MDTTTEIAQVGEYRLTEKLYDGSRTVVYRAIRSQDQKAVVIKLLRRKSPTFQELLQFRNQYAIVKNLSIPGIVRFYSLESYRHSYALVMEDFGGISLKEYAQGLPLSLKEVLAIALQLTDILHTLYQNRVIHKDIKPANILIHPQTRQIKLIDFSIASLLPKETPEIKNPNGLEGTLAYLAPEQTGRMNRGIDYRADFYALGVTLFELLTGQLPFTTTDPMELVHCHLAQQPLPLNRLRQEIPQVLSDLVLKLMAKNAEDRYQSALGLKQDLATCWYHLQTNDRIPPFPLGRRDVCDRFLIPEKLYGRQQEVQTLLDAFDRVASGTSEIMLVAGFSGIGKTAAINEVHKPIVRQRGYFIKGKFDQFQRNIPLSAFVYALRSLMGQLLSETDEQLAQWKSTLLSILGENGQAIVQVIPELEQIIGPQPPVSELSGEAAQNRFNLLFPKFIQVFATADHPLVIFLDDLQWADSASLKLIHLLMSHWEVGHLLLIGAYRDNEVSPAHPLLLTLQEIGKANVIINTLTLAPLELADLNLLVADTLNCSPELAIALTEIIYQKTKGNPFFATQFLKALHEEKWIKFNYDLGYWQCDLVQIRTLALTDDVVEFMAAQLQKLPPSTQEALKLAACIGNQFDLVTLAMVCEKSEAETASDIWKSLQEGLILPTSEIYKFFQQESELNHNNLSNICDSLAERCCYKFLHDRVQQAAYSLIPPDQKQVTHLKIGQQLLHHTPLSEQDEKLFEIVNQLNLGQSLIVAPIQQTELAELNLKATRKARAATAYTAAYEYSTTGISLLATNCWEAQYELSLALYETATEAAYLSGHLEKTTQFATVILEQARSLLDTLKVYEIKIQAAQAQHQFLEAVQLALQILEQLGIHFPAQTSESEIAQACEITHNLIGSRHPLDLQDLPSLTDPEKLAALRILTSVSSAAFVVTPMLLPFLILEQVNLSIQYGNASYSANGYAYYGLMLCGVMGEIERGYQFGQLALQLLKQFEAKDLQARTYVGVHCSVWHWKKPLNDTLPFLLEGYHSGLETGDLESATICAFVYIMHGWFIGKDLSELSRESAAFRGQLAQLSQSGLSSHLTIFQQAILNLLGDETEPWQLQGSAFDREQMLPLLEESGDRTALCYLYISQLILCYLFGQFEEAIEAAIALEGYLNSATGLFLVPLYHTYDSLAHLALYSQGTECDRQRILQRVNHNQDKLKTWSTHSPDNHLHKFELVEAERYRILGQKSQAIECYDRAIADAKDHGYLQEAALANELAAQFYLAWGKEGLARDYLQEAYYDYARWGAATKVQQLETSYPTLLASILQPESVQLTTDFALQITNTISHTNLGKSKTSSSHGISTALDLATLLKVSQTLSREIQFEQLLSKVLQITIENAGADKCALLLVKEDRLRIEAFRTVGQGFRLLFSLPLSESQELPISVIQNVQRSLQPIAMTDATDWNAPIADPYLIHQQPKSLLCMPILLQGKFIGILYLENSITLNAFTRDRIELLNVLCTQVAISLENARLYQASQSYAHQLEHTLKELQTMQLQLVQSEKMSALGNLVAGVAHEINNPVGFIAGNLEPAQTYINDLLELIDLYQKKLPHPDREIEEEIATIDLEYLRVDLPKLIDSMKLGVDRIRGISTSLRTFSRADKDYKVTFNIHDGLDSTLLILKHRLKATENRPEIEVLKEYGDCPSIPCFPGQLNQVFMNLLANAIDALEEVNQGRSSTEIKLNSNRILVRTEIQDREWLIVQISDNGIGISEAVKQHIFEHLFTTKAVGKGTGLGLAIARQIVVEKHGGEIEVSSEPGKGTKFTIKLPLL